MHTLVSRLHYSGQISFQYLQGSQLFLLIFNDRLRRDHLLGDATGYQKKVFLADFDPGLFGVELAYPDTVARLFEVELFRLVAREFDHVQPTDGSSLLAMILEDPRRSVEQSLEPLDQDGTQGSRAKVAGHGLVAVKDTIVVGNATEEEWERIIGGDQR